MASRAPNPASISSPSSSGRYPIGKRWSDLLREMLDDVDLYEFYERVEKLIPDLRESGHQSEADEVESAIRGGATSGEVLGRLSMALPAVANRLPKEFRSEIDELAAWASETLGRQ